MTSPAAPGHMATTPGTRRQLVPSLGTSRRLKALMLDGHTQREIATELGIPERTVGSLVGQRWATISATTAAAVAQLTERWADLPGSNPKVISYARSQGWKPLSYWNNIDRDPEVTSIVADEFAIQLACEGVIQLRKLHPLEQNEVVRRLAAGPKSAQEIADRLQISKRTVERARSVLAAEEAARRWAFLTAYFRLWATAWQQRQTIALVPTPRRPERRTGGREATRQITLSGCTGRAA